MTSKKKTQKKAQQPKRVTRAFLLKVAKDIYDPKDRSYLRLCGGTLQNGPDPKDKKRVMHCGLGELYFAMMGQHPEDHPNRSLQDDDVVELVVEHSTVHDEARATYDRDLAAVKKLKISPERKRDLLHALGPRDDVDDEDRDYQFRNLLGAIPDINDEDHEKSDEEDEEEQDGDEHEGTEKKYAIETEATYRARARRVAAQLRKAAAVLPK